MVMFLRHAIFYLFVVPLIAIYLLPLFAQIPAEIQAEADAYSASGQFLNWRGKHIWFRTEKSGSKSGGASSYLLYVHGFPTCSADFGPMVAAMRSRFDVQIQFDMLGFGASSKPPHHNYTMVEQADIAQAVLRQVLLANGLKQPHVQSIYIVAHDYGNSVVQELLARIGTGPTRLLKFVPDSEASRAGPDDAPLAVRVDSVMFLNGGLIPGAHRPLTSQWLLAHPIAGPLLQRLGFVNYFTFASALRKVFGPLTQPTDHFLQLSWALLERHDGARVMPRLLQYMHERKVHKNRWVGALQHTQIPLKFIIGPKDPISGKHLADAVNEALGGKADLTLLTPVIGHYPQVEAPDEVAQAYLRFLVSRIHI